MADAKRIDVHHHLLPEFYIEVQKAAGMRGSAYGAFPVWSAERSVALMDRLDIAAAILSFTAPGIYFGDVAQTAMLARRCNDYLAELVAGRPRRFGAFAQLPLPDVEASLREIAHALDVLKLDGICHLTQVADRYVGHPDYEPVYAELNRRKAVVFIHPVYPPKSATRDWIVPSSFIDYPLETTRTIANMIYTGLLERLPDIRFILSHAGGAMPFLAHRLELFDTLTPLRERFPKGSRHYLKRLYYDTTLSTHPVQLDALRALADPMRILFGTDYPYVPESVVDAEFRGLEAYRGFDPDARRAMERGNAATLFPRLAAG